MHRRRCGVTGTTSRGEPVSVTAWNELAHPGLKLLKLPGCALRVLVGGQHAGAVWFEDDAWHAEATA